jgi:pyridoxal phosphate enzyme (YggS family)
MDLEVNLLKIRQRIEQSCGRAERNPDSITLLAVSKNQPPSAVEAAKGLGLTLFGESKVQEAKAKIPECSSRVHWHLIGHLQTNKCRDAVQLFEMIQSVDSLALAEEINKRAEQIGKNMPILLEVNVAAESSKYGYSPDKLLADLQKINQLSRLEIHGLMTVPPWSPDLEKVRPVFRSLRELKLQCEEILGASLPQLSMGMTGDFEIAIEEGSTLIRIGTGLFGPRRSSGT